MSTARRFTVAVLAVAVATLLAACTGKDAVSSDPNAFRFVSATDLGKTYPIGERKDAGLFTEKLIDGNGTYSLKDDLGSVVVINFWAAWCGPCTVESPQFDLVYRAYKSKGVKFVGIDTKDTHDGGKTFVANNDISYPNVWDEKGETALELGKIPSRSLPFTVIVDKHGKIAVVYLDKMTAKDLEPMLDSLTAEA
ncbi:MAG TPA: TlpA disulfide reductase family protein [Jatrophihabitans sp.]